MALDFQVFSLRLCIILQPNIIYFQILDKDEDRNWYKAEQNDQEGWIPNTYITMRPHRYAQILPEDRCDSFIFKFLFRFTSEFQCFLASDLKRRMCCYEMWDKFFGCTIDDV